MARESVRARCMVIGEDLGTGARLASASAWRRTASSPTAFVVRAAFGRRVRTADASRSWRWPRPARTTSDPSRAGSRVTTSRWTSDRGCSMRYRAPHADRARGGLRAVTRGAALDRRLGEGVPDTEAIVLAAYRYLAACRRWIVMLQIERRASATLAGQHSGHRSCVSDWWCKSARTWNIVARRPPRRFAAALRELRPHV